jgi:hypothetical protein
MAVTRGIVKIVPHQTKGRGQGGYLKAVGIRFTVVLKPPRRPFFSQIIDNLLTEVAMEFPHLASVDTHCSITPVMPCTGVLPSSVVTAGGMNHEASLFATQAPSRRMAYDGASVAYAYSSSVAYRST